MKPVGIRGAAEGGGCNLVSEAAALRVLPTDTGQNRLMSPSLRFPHAQSIWWPVSASLALALPMLLAFNVPPSSTFLNQAAALIGWGSWLTLLAAAVRPGCAWPGASGLAALQAVLGLLLLSALAAPLWTGLPWSLALSGAGMIAAAEIGRASCRERV